MDGIKDFKDDASECQVKKIAQSSMNFNLKFQIKIKSID
jgi:hypothetical protein